MGNLAYITSGTSLQRLKSMNSMSEVKKEYWWSGKDGRYAL